ncbi:MAG: hypothetical protein ACK5IN_02760 [Microbacterium sp.]|uniref:hypothetical protein n=1 Tax=Microbacterium sp. TaxID=51671 RepID=UPI003A872680
MSRRWATRPWGAVRIGAMVVAALAVVSVAVFARGNASGLTLAVMGGGVTGAVIALRVLGEHDSARAARLLGYERVHGMAPDAVWAGVVWIVLSLGVGVASGTTDAWGLLSTLATTPLWAVGVCVGVVGGLWLWVPLVRALDAPPHRVPVGWALGAGILALFVVFVVCTALTAPAVATAAGRPGGDVMVVVDVLSADVSALGAPVQTVVWVARGAAALTVVLLVWTGVRRARRRVG